METIADEDLLAVKGYDGGAVAEDGSKRVVTHSDAPTRDRVVRDERGFVRKHVIGGSGVGDE